MYFCRRNVRNGYTSSVGGNVRNGYTSSVGGNVRNGYTSSVGGNSDSRPLILYSVGATRGTPTGVHTVDLPVATVLHSVGGNSDSRHLCIPKNYSPMKLPLFNNSLLGIFLPFLFFGAFRDSDKERCRESEFPPTECNVIQNVM